MSDKTGIEWTDATWNPVTGCSKVSAGCKHCYAERDWARLSANPATRYYGRKFTDVRMHLDVIELPLRWKRPRRIFVNSMSDLFHPDVDDRFISDVFGVMAACPQHDFQVLTKRPERALQLLGAGCMGGFESAVEDCMALYTDRPLVWPLPNVWLGVSVEDQATGDERIPLLLKTLAAVRWISAEPLLGPVDLTCWLAANDLHKIDGGPCITWVVAGGESGANARWMHPNWVRSLRDQCADMSVPFLFKQWGEWSPMHWTPYGVWSIGGEGNCAEEVAAGRWLGPCEERMYRTGKKNSGRLLDGVQHDGYPDHR